MIAIAPTLELVQCCEPELPEEILRDDVKVLREESAQINAEIETHIQQAKDAGCDVSTW